MSRLINSYLFNQKCWLKLKKQKSTYILTYRILFFVTSLQSNRFLYGFFNTHACHPSSLKCNHLLIKLGMQSQSHLEGAVGLLDWDLSQIFEMTNPYYFLSMVKYICFTCFVVCSRIITYMKKFMEDFICDIWFSQIFSNLYFIWK